MQITTDTFIDRPPTEVFAVLSDYRRDRSWRAAVVEMQVEPDAPVTTGSRIVETLEFDGRTYVTRTTVTACSPEDGFLSFAGGNEAMGVRGSRTVTAEGAGTRVRQMLEFRPHGTMRLLAPLLKRSYAAVARQDLAELRRTLEAPAGITGTVAPAR